MSELETQSEAPEEQFQEGQADGATEGEKQAAERQPINLDELPEFRQWKSKMDRKLAQEQAERQRLQEQLEKSQSRLDELALRDASPDERERFYQEKITQLEEQQRLQQERQKQVAEATEAAQEFLDALGLDMDTPGLDFSGDPTTVEGFQRFTKSAAQIAREQRTETKEEVDAKVREAEQQAAKKTGAAKVSTATGQPSALRKEYDKRREQLRGTGDFRAFAELKAEFRKKGLEI